MTTEQSRTVKCTKEKVAKINCIIDCRHRLYTPFLNYFKVKDTMVFTNDMETILSIGKYLEIDPHCPCIVAKNDNTICPCLPCRSKQHCHCGMFVPIGSQEDYFQVKYGTK